MPVPKPERGEKQKKFIPRCMGDETMVKDFKDVKQRYAVCINTFETEKKKQKKD